MMIAPSAPPPPRAPPKPRPGGAKKAVPWTKRASRWLGLSAHHPKKRTQQQPKLTPHHSYESVGEPPVPLAEMERRRAVEARRKAAEERRKAVERRRELERLKRDRLEAAEAAATASAAEAERNAPVEVASARANRVIALQDGRHLSFAEAGDPLGFPVLCFFGIGGSRYLVLLLDDVARQMGLRVISIDRPGFGRSTFVRDRGFRDFAKDVETLVLALNLKRVAIWGYSVGCAYAAVCCQSRLLRRRLAARTTMVSPWVPLSSPGVPVHFSVARFFPQSVAHVLKPNDVVEKRAELKRRGSEATIQASGDDDDVGVKVDVLALSAPSARLDRFGLGLGGGGGAAAAKEPTTTTGAKTLSSSEAALEEVNLSAHTAPASLAGRLFKRGGETTTTKKNERENDEETRSPVVVPPTTTLGRSVSASASSPTKKNTTAWSSSSSSSLNFLLCGSGFFQGGGNSYSAAVDDEESVSASTSSSSKREEDYGELTQVEMRALEMLPRGPRVLLASIIESQRQGGRGFSDEFRLCCSDFDFEYADLAWPTRVYHGTNDNLVSTQSVRWLVSRLRTKVPDEHLIELFQVLGGTHNGMVFAILKRSLAAISNDITTRSLQGDPWRVNYDDGPLLDDDDDDDGYDDDNNNEGDSSGDLGWAPTDDQDDSSSDEEEE